MFKCFSLWIRRICSAHDSVALADPTGHRPVQIHLRFGWWRADHNWVTRESQQSNSPCNLLQCLVVFKQRFWVSANTQPFIYCFHTVTESLLDWAGDVIVERFSTETTAASQPRWRNFHRLHFLYWTCSGCYPTVCHVGPFSLLFSVCFSCHRLSRGRAVHSVSVERVSG